MCALNIKQGSLPPPALYCAGLFSALDPVDPNPALRECEGIDGKGSCSIKKANEQHELHFPDDALLGVETEGTFITFK